MRMKTLGELLLEEETSTVRIPVPEELKPMEELYKEHEIELNAARLLFEMRMVQFAFLGTFPSEAQ